ncbi:HET-domain-containing protein, partial [Aaosphaeria arxii CBS 175.79]
MSDIFLPTRVLDLGEPGQIPLDADVRLYETGGNIQGMYMTLSHCWGGALPIMTLSGNLEAHKQKVSWEKLPRTFRDAIRVTRRLAVRYLWIDSLCIIQDDKNDWLVEAARMGRVYQESYLTIAATAAPNGDGGLFPSSSAPAKTRFHELKPSSTGQQGQDVDESSMFLRRQLNHDAFSTFSPDGPRLLTRGWVYQERVLSQRVIHFSDDELLWECRGRFACECGSAQARTSQIATVKQGQADGRAGSTWRVGYSAANSAGYNFDDHVAHNTGEAVHRPKRYRAMVSDYTRLHLTFARDRLPAFAGIARLYGGAGRGDYVAGLWTGSLASDLLWEVA